MASVSKTPPPSAETPPPLFTRDFVLLCLVTLGFFASFFFFFPTLPFYIKHLGGQALYLGVSLYAMGVGLAQPGLGAFVIDRLTPERRGIGMATFAQGLDLGMGLGGVLMGSIATQAGFTSMYLGGSGCLAVALAIFVWGSRTSEAQP